MSRKILIIDDSVSSRNLVWLALNSAGYRVVQAVDGEDGLAKAEQEKPDLIVTDLNMPNLDGLGFTEKLRESGRFSDVPILILSSETQRQVKVAAAQVGVTAWLAKPFKPEALLAAVRKFLPQATS